MEKRLSCNVERGVFSSVFHFNNNFVSFRLFFRNREKTKLARELGMMSSRDLLQWRPSCENVFELFFFALIRATKRNSKCKNLDFSEKDYEN